MRPSRVSRLNAAAPTEVAPVSASEGDTRICVQATHPDYNPETEWYDQTRLQAMIDANLPVAITLRPR